MMQRKPNQAYLEKDTVTRNWFDSSLVNNGPFSLQDGDIISMMQSGGSKLMQWMPSRGVKHRQENIRHLAFVTMDGHTGSQSYLDFLASQPDIDECDYGPAPTWNGMEYRTDFYQFSFKSKTFKYPDHTGVREWEREPRNYIRGSLQGTSIASDIELGLSQLAYVSEQHMNWNLVHGNPSVVPTRNPGASEGLSTIINTGWVAARRVGPGESNFIDPIVVDGSGFATTDGAEALRMIQMVVRRIRGRAEMLGTNVDADMAVVMNAAHWAKISEAIAAGNLAASGMAANFTLTAGDYFDLKNRVTVGGLGDGFIPVDNRPVPIIIENSLGSNIYGTPNQVQGDIYILTRRIHGLNILENQYLDYRMLTVIPELERTVMANGFYSTGALIDNSKCFTYFMENEFRTISRMQPLQARITGVVLDAESSMELLEGSNFTHDDFYAYGDGNQAGGGTDFIRGYGSY